MWSESGLVMFVLGSLLWMGKVVSVVWKVEYVGEVNLVG